MAWQLTDFLDQSYYLLAAILLVALAAEQIVALRQARRGQSDEEARASLLEERLREAQGRDRFVALKDGTRVHRVSEAEIIFVRAADDYCEAHLADGRAILVTANLAAVHASLPERFLRVHKSYVVNADHVASVSPRPGGGRARRCRTSRRCRSGGPIARRWRKRSNNGRRAEIRRQVPSGMMKSWPAGVRLRHCRRRGGRAAQVGRDERGFALAEQLGALGRKIVEDRGRDAAVEEAGSMVRLR